ncbi:MAG: FAD-binding oxidoreductase [Xanthomonadales bacterium]|nr:FAD-binding oxidoreductase [Xanthomonadales bacterium]
MSGHSHQSWGRWPRASQQVLPLYWPDDQLPATGDLSLLPRGNGRSYGDVCLNDGGALLDCRQLNRFVSFDPEHGRLACEAGVLLGDIQRLTLPRGWMLSVSPGTQFVTVGGAIANDVHGKNHHRAGTFGRHVVSFELRRTDGSCLQCSPSENPELFRATVGGLGLTGVITRAEIQLKPVSGAYLDQQTVSFDHLDRFFELAAEADRQHEYTVAWIDCLARGPELGRGLLMTADHRDEANCSEPARRRLSVPFELPVSPVRSWSVRQFNRWYFNRQRRNAGRRRVHYQPFFYPLDAVGQWNRVYGRSGFYQYQCVIPEGQAREAVSDILERVSDAGSGSFLAVLKRFGDLPSPGLLSFPMPGVTLALDFANQGQRTLDLMDSLDQLTHAAGGRVNPSKDARMSAAHFQQAYPGWKQLQGLADPGLSSSFWRRVTVAP